MRIKRNIKAILGVAAGFVAVVALVFAVAFFISPSAFAQVNVDDTLGVTFGLGTADLVSTIINIVQWALGFLGLVAVIFIMYGGFIWMTAGGNEEKVAKAKKIITRAVIGLVIVLLSWAIVLFIVDRIQKSTGAGGPLCTPLAVNGCFECNAAGNAWVYQAGWPGCGLPGNALYVKWVNPAENATNVYLCSIVQSEFNDEIDPASVVGNAHLFIDGGSPAGVVCAVDGDCASQDCAGTCQGGEVSGAWNVAGRLVYFFPDENYVENTTYRVEYDIGGIDDLTPPDPNYDPFAGKTWWFTTGSLTLSTPPTVTGIFPSDGATDICLNTAIQTVFSSDMFAASLNKNTVTLTNLTLALNEDLKTPFSYTPDSFSTRPLAPLNAGEQYSVELTAGTPGSNDPDDGVMDICLNHLDGEEDGSDDGTVGGDDFLEIVPPSPNPTFPNEPWDFFADTDTTNTQCIPEITGIAPASSLYSRPADPPVAISGSNFGIVGNVYFNRNVIDLNNCFNGGNFPNQDCVVNWLEGVIDTRVPAGPPEFVNAGSSAGAMDGGVFVDVAGELSNSWNFDVTSPQIHRASGLNDQPHGGVGQFVSLLKRADANAGFGAGPSFGLLHNLNTGAVAPFGIPGCANWWTDSQVIIKMTDISGPPLNIPACDVGAVGGWQNCPAASQVGIQLYRDIITPSNLTKFIFTNEPPGPGLCEAVPNCGVAADPITLNGDAFGAGPGAVWFKDPPAAPISAPIAGWTPTSINATIPNPIDNANYSVNVEDSNNISSNAVGFSVPCGDVPRVLENSSCANHCVLNPGILCPTGSECPPGDACTPGMASPNPWRGLQDVCVNAIVGAKFVDGAGMPISMDAASLNNVNIKLFRCDDPDNSPTCTVPSEVLGAVITTFPAPDDDRFTLTPPAALDTDRWYRIDISKDVMSAPPDPANMSNDYYWVFKTKVDTGPCPVENVIVSPGNTVLYNIGDTQGYIATPTGPNCTLLDPAVYDWQPWTSDAPVIASVTGASGMGANTDTATANALGTTYINAETEGKIGKGLLKVDPDSCIFDPDRCADPNNDGIDECEFSVCEVVSDRCTPVINSLAPPQGPRGTTDSVAGCWFGNREGELIYGGSLATFECANAWTRGLIVGTVPNAPLGLQTVEVVTASGNRSLVNDGTIGLWHLDEGAGVTASDSSGNGNDGILQNGPVWIAGRHGNGLLFNGLNQYVDAGNAIPDPGNGSYSVSFWQRRTSDADITVSKGYFDGANTHGWWFRSNSAAAPPPDQFKFYISVGDGAATQKAMETAASNDDKWHWFVGVIDRDTDNVLLYKDGVLQQSNDISAILNPITSGNSLYLGSGSDVTNSPISPFEGMVDEVRIYDRVLTDIEIANNYIAGLSNVIHSGQDGVMNPAVEFNVTNLCASLCAGGANAFDYCTGPADCDSGVCSPGVPPPPDGVPGICPPLVPASGKEGTDVLVEGFRLLNALDTTNTRVYYNEGLADAYADVVGRGETWDINSVNKSRVPVGTETGDLMVQVNNCPSNALTFGIGCNIAADCGSGCCLGNICQPAAMCSSGAPGTLCQLTTNNPFCQVGPASPADYRCIDPVGHLEPEPPLSYPYPPVAVDDCRICCDPDQNNDGDVTDDPMTLGTLECVPDVGACVSASGTERGLYCGCTSDLQCGDPTIIGCGFNDGRPSNCCYGRPTLNSTIPNAAFISMCTNFSIEYVFDTSTPGLRMDPSTIELNTSVFVEDGALNPIPGSITHTPTGFIFSPSPAFSPGITIWVRYRADLIKDMYGVAVSDVPNDLRSLTWSTNGAAVVCTIDHLSFRWWAGGPMYPPPSLYTCALDQCEPISSMHRDALPAALGPDNERLWLVAAEDVNNTLLTGNIDFTWDDVSADPKGIFTATLDGGPPIVPPCPVNQTNNFQCFLKSDNMDGTGYLTVTADGTASAVGDIGKVTQSAPILGYMCNNLWPNPFPPDFDEMPFEDSTVNPKPDSISGLNNFTTNFSAWYCRDDGISALDRPGDIIVREGTPVGGDGIDDMIKEYFFKRAGTNDAIGIRVMENEIRRSPLEWYRSQFGQAAPEPQDLTVDGYQAVRAGRTVYVAATNVLAGQIFPNVYLISYNEGASEETITIYNRLLANWEFNIDMAIPDDKPKLQRDMKRLNDLGDIYSKMLDYKGANSEFPKLEGGTYLANVSGSRWPSWQDTLGSQLGATLPVDPLNTFNLPHPAQCLEASGYNQDTCWDDADKSYECPSDTGPPMVGSQIYQYVSSPTGESADLYARLEYSRINLAGDWLVGMGPAIDPCAGIPNAVCSCFNYQYDITGSASDRTGPVINSVDALVSSGVNVIMGTRTLDVDAVDAVSGVDRVEFFMDGVRTFTDDDGTDGWSWDLDTTIYTDGDHVLMVNAYDRVGNLTSVSFALNIDNAGGPDNIPPFVSITSHSDGDTVTGAAETVTVISTDNRIAQSITIEIRNVALSALYDSNTCGGNTTSEHSCSFVWDTTTYTNGDYAIRAIASDAAANAAQVVAVVTVNNDDIVPPSMTIDNPLDGSTVEDVVNFDVTATDNIGMDRVDFYVDGIFRGSDYFDGDNSYTWSWNTRATTNGDYELMAYAFDLVGNSAFDPASPITVTVDNEENDITPPVVNFIPPTPATGSSVDGIITIAVDATDDIGVDEVYFYIDYVKRFTDYSYPWSWGGGVCTGGGPNDGEFCMNDSECPGVGASCSLSVGLDTSTLSDGWHRIQVDAVDATGNRSESIEIRVNVRGPGGPDITYVCVSPSSGPIGTVFTFNAEVTETPPDTVVRVEASIQQPDENEMRRVIMYDDGTHSDAAAGDDMYGNTWTSDFENAIWVDIEAEDNLGNISEFNNIPSSCSGPPPPPLASIYAGTSPNGDIFKTTDGGASWTQISLPGVSQVRTIIDASDGMYAGTLPAFVFKSTDGGLTWNPTTGTLPGAPTVVNFLMEASDGKIFAGTDPSGDLYRTSDGGASWTQIPFPGAWWVRSMVEGSDGLYVGTDAGSGEVFKSTDGGLTWNPTTGTLVGAGTTMGLLAASDGSVYAASSNGVDGLVYRTTDGGASWPQIGLPPASQFAFTFHEASDGTIFVGTGGNGDIFTTIDLGVNWTQINLPGATYVRTIIDASDGMYAGTTINGEVFKSTDGGLTWNPTTGTLVGATTVSSLLEVGP